MCSRTRSHNDVDLLGVLAKPLLFPLDDDPEGAVGKEPTQDKQKAE